MSMLFYVIGILFTCMSMYRVHAWSWQRSEEGLRSLETGVTEGCVNLTGISLQCQDRDFVFKLYHETFRNTNIANLWHILSDILGVVMFTSKMI